MVATTDGLVASGSNPRVLKEGIELPALALAPDIVIFRSRLHAGLDRKGPQRDLMRKFPIVSPAATGPRVCKSS